MKEIRLTASDPRNEELERLSQLMGMTMNKELFPGIGESDWDLINREIKNLTNKYFHEGEESRL